MDVRSLFADDLLTVSSPQRVLDVVGAILLDQVGIRSHIAVSSVTGGIGDITTCQFERTNLHVLKAIGLRVQHNAVGRGKGNRILAPSVYSGARDNLGVVGTFHEDHCIVSDLGGAIVLQSQSLIGIGVNRILTLEASFVGIGDSLDLVLVAVHGEGVNAINDGSHSLAVASTTSSTCIRARSRNQYLACLGRAGSHNFIAINLRDQCFFRCTISEVQLGVQASIQTRLDLQTINIQNICGSSSGIGDLNIKCIPANGHNVNSVTNIEGLARHQRGVPGAVNQALSIVVAGTGHFASHNSSFLHIVIAVYRIAICVNDNPVILGNAVISSDVVHVLVADGGKAVNSLEGHGRGSYIGNFSNRKGRHNCTVNLAVSVVVDQLNAVSILHTAVSLRQRNQCTSICRFVKVIDLSAGINLILGAVQLDLLAVTGYRIQVTHHAGGNHFGVLIGINAIDLGLIAIFHHDVNLLAHQIRVVLFNLGIRRSSILVRHDDIVGALAVLINTGQNTIIHDGGIVLVLQQGDGIVGIVQFVNRSHLGGVAAHPSVLILDFASLQGVPHHLGRSVAGQGSGDIQTFQALVQALLGGTDVDIHVPSVAGVALDVRIEAQADQQHLSQLGAGHIAVGAEPAAAHTRHDALGHAGLNVLLRPSSVGGVAHVGERGGGRCAQGGLLAAVQSHTNHFGDLRTLNVPFGLIRPVRIPADDVQHRAGINGLSVLDLVLIRERRPGAHDHDRQHHSHTEHQAQNLLLGELLAPQCFAPQFPTDFTRRSHAIF